MPQHDLRTPHYQAAITVLGVNWRATEAGPIVYPDWDGGGPALLLPETMHPLRQIDEIRKLCDEVERRLTSDAWAVLTDGAEDDR